MLPTRYISFVLIVTAILTLLVMLRLGVWQLDRAAEKQTITNNVLAMSSTQIELGSQAVNEQHRYAQANVIGQYRSGQTFLLDGQVVNGRVGYHVVTPFDIADSDLVVLVNRGWVPVGSSREVKPEVVTPEGELRLLGRLNLPASKPVFWNEKIPVVQKGAWQFLDLHDYSQRTGVDVLPLLIELDKTLDQVGGYVRQWRSYDNHWVSRHRAYAFQWFAMATAFFVLCIFVWRKSQRT